MLKYPDCEECKLLYNIGVDDNLINKFHEDKATISQLPKPAQKVLRKWRERKGYTKKEDSDEE